MAGLDFNMVKRLAAFIVGLLVVVLNNKLGLGLTEADKVTMASLIAVYLGQSAIKDTVIQKAQIHADAEVAKVATGNQAADALNDALVAAPASSK
jgi:hypothetical protein